MNIFFILVCVLLFVRIFCGDDVDSDQVAAPPTQQQPPPHRTQAPSGRTQELLELAQEQEAQRAVHTQELKNIAQQNLEKKQARTQELLDISQQQQDATHEKEEVVRDIELIKVEEASPKKDVSIQAQEAFDKILNPYTNPPTTDGILDQDSNITWPGDSNLQITMLKKINYLLDDINSFLRTLNKKSNNDPLKKYIFKAPFSAPGRTAPFKRVTTALQSVKGIIDSEFANLRADQKTSRTTKRTLTNIENSYANIIKLIKL